MVMGCNKPTDDGFVKCPEMENHHFPPNPWHLTWGDVFNLREVNTERGQWDRSEAKVKLLHFSRREDCSLNTSK